MLWFLMVLIFYVGVLLGYKPEPFDLRQRIPSFQENYRAIRGSLFLGIFLAVSFLIMSDFGFRDATRDALMLLAINNGKVKFHLLPFQAVTHLFTHINMVHLLTNVAGIGLMSVYERRVGLRRYLDVLAVGCLASIPSILFYSKPVFVCGISGGIFGLAAAHFTDRAHSTMKEWLLSIGTFVTIAAMFTLYSLYKSGGKPMGAWQVDHIGHVLGAVGAIIYCRYAPLGRCRDQKNNLK